MGTICTESIAMDNVSFSANQQQSFSPKTYLDPARGRQPGSYRAIVRGKVAGDDPFNFEVVPNSGAVNPKSFSAVAPTPTPEREAPKARYLDNPGAGCTAPTGRNAVVITHGWLSEAVGEAKGTVWVDSMAIEICKLKAPEANLELTYENAISPACSGSQWDVWVVDWRDRAFNLIWDQYCREVLTKTPKQWAKH